MVEAVLVLPWLWMGVEAMTTREILDMSEQRMMLWRKQHGRCKTCHAAHPTPHTMEMAHRIPQDRPSKALYGLAVIHHPLNTPLVCRGSDACNSRQSLRNKPLATARLVARIHEALGEPVVEA